MRTSRPTFWVHIYCPFHDNNWLLTTISRDAFMWHDVILYMCPRSTYSFVSKCLSIVVHVWPIFGTALIDLTWHGLIYCHRHMIFSNRGYFMMFRMVHLTMTIDIQKFYKTYQHYIINITIYNLLHPPNTIVVIEYIDICKENIYFSISKNFSINVFNYKNRK